jgi:hypothetical protein
MSSDSPLPTSNLDSKSADDTTILASLQYKQDLRRHFTTLIGGIGQHWLNSFFFFAQQELFGFGFSLNAIDVACVVFCSRLRGLARVVPTFVTLSLRLFRLGMRKFVSLMEKRESSSFRRTTGKTHHLPFPANHPSAALWFVKMCSDASLMD